MTQTTERSASEKARKLVANHEKVTMAMDMLGATEVGDAERLVLDYIAEIESQLSSARSRIAELEKDAKRWRHFADHMALIGCNEDGDPSFGASCGDMDDFRVSHPEMAAKLDAHGMLDNAADVEALVDYDMSQSVAPAEETHT